MRRSILMIAAILGTSALSFPRPVVATPPNREEIRALLKAQWDSLETVAYRCETFDLDSQGRPNRAKGANRYDVAIGSGGRRMLRETAVEPTRERNFSDSRDDGRRHVSLRYFEGRPDVLDSATIVNPRRGHDEYSGPLTGPIWTFLPDGKPLYTWLDAEASLEQARGDDGADLVVLEFTGKFGPVRCELDPQHDWLARRVSAPNIPMVNTVTQFVRDNGRWMAAEGTETLLSGKKEHRQFFEVTHLRVNRVPDAVFQVPRFPEGTAILDRTKGPYGNVTYVGGQEARKRLEAKYAPSEPPPSSPTGVPIVARHDPGAWPLAALLAGGSVILIVAGAVLRWRQGR